MRPYSFFKHDGSSVLPTFDLAEVENDDEARAFALKLLADGPQYHAVEVWNGSGEPFTVKRGSVSA